MTEYASQAPDFSINLFDLISFSARPYFEDLDSLLARAQLVKDMSENLKLSRRNIMTHERRNAMIVRKCGEKVSSDPKLVPYILPLIEGAVILDVFVGVIVIG